MEEDRIGTPTPQAAADPIFFHPGTVRGAFHRLYPP
jgi:hypothetical protein